MAKSKKKASKVRVVLLSVLCCILTLVLSTLLVIAVTARQFAETNSLAEATEELDINDIRIQDGGKTVTAAEFILDHFVEDESVNVEDVEAVLEEKNITRFAAEIMEDYTVYFLDGGKFPVLQTEDFLSLMEEMEDDIYEATGLRFGNGDMEALEEDLDDALDDINGVLKHSVGEGVSGFMARALFSVWLEVVLGILLLGILIWMLLTYAGNSCRAGSALKTFSITGFVVCVLLLLGALLSSLALEWAGVAFLNPLVGAFACLLLVNAGIGAGACIVLFVVGVLCSKLIPVRTVPVEELPVSADAPMPDAADTAPAPETPAVQPAEEIPAEVPVQAETPQARFCQHCGKELTIPDARFCSHCGGVQESAEQPSENESPVQ